MHKKKTLKKIVQKKLFAQRFLLNTCLAVSGLYLLNTTLSIACDVKNHIENKAKPSQSTYLNIINLILFSFLFKTGLKIRRKEPDILLKEPSVSKTVLNKLCYLYDREEQQDDVYSSLTKKDIENLCKRIDFSSLTNTEQYHILQNMILTANANPIASKILKSELLPCSLKIDNNLDCGGHISHAAQAIKRGTIYIYDSLDYIAVTHEFLHAKQIMDGAFLLKDLRYYSSLMNEAQAKALNLIIESNINPEYYPFYFNAEEKVWPKKITNHFLQISENETTNLPERTKRAKAQEKTMGVIMKCLLEENEQLRENIAQSYCDNKLSKQDLEYMNNTMNSWRRYYIKDDYKRKEEGISKILPSLKNELNLIPLMDDYFSTETGIKQSVASIKISSCKNSAIYDYLSNQKQKTK